MKSQRRAVLVAILLCLAAAPLAAQDQAAKVQQAVVRLKSTEMWTRVSASMELVRLAPAIGEALPALSEALSDPTIDVRWNSARALGIMGPEAKAAVPALISALKRSDWLVQISVVWALARIGSDAREAVPALVEAMKSNRNVAVRWEAARALGAIGTEARAALPALEAALSDENGFVRVMAAASLWQVGQDARSLPLLTGALKDQTVVGTRVAADVLADLGPAAKDACPALVAALKDPAACARVAVARALWRIDRRTDGVPALLGALRDVDPEVRADAATLLRQIGAATGKAFPELSRQESAPAKPAGAQPLVFETEDWTGPVEAIATDKDTANLWKHSTKDTRWSKSTVLVSPVVAKDRATPEEGAPPLHTHITGIPNGSYQVSVSYTRPLALSLDAGKTWTKYDGKRSIGTFDVKDGTFDLWVDDRYADANSIGGSYYDYLTFTPVKKQTPTLVKGFAKTRVRERLERGLMATRLPEGGVYLSWRLLAADPKGTGFDVYRREGKAAARRLNKEAVTRTTDFVDTAAPAGPCRYNVTLAGKPADRIASRPAEVGAAGEAAEAAYQSIKLQGKYTAQRVGIADLDGDGRLDYVIKQPDYSIDPYYLYWHRSPETYKLEAYNADGKFLWRHDLGWGIEMGVWFSPYVVHDLDGDGRAEVACKAAGPDPRNAEGKVLDGPEYIDILDGATGKLRCRADWPSREGFSGESGHNLAARNQMGIAYLDGKTPCLVVERGTYSLQKLDAYQLRGKALERLWSWDNSSLDREWRGQGAHTLHAADVDGDGRDEVLLGSSVVDDTGVALWTSGLGHPDCFFVGEIDPAHPGYEIFYNIEPAQKQSGVCLRDARTGALLWGRKDPTYHVGSGMASDIDAAHPGCECWAAEDAKSGAFKGAPPRWLFSAAGEILGEDAAVPPFRAAYWDADLQRELLSGSQIRDFGGGTYAPGFRGSLLAVADVAGDWREELITALPGELRIYRTTVPAADRHVCLMQDPIYRMDVALASMGYYQVPMLSTCLAGSRAALEITGPASGLTVGEANSCALTLVAPAGKEVAGTVRLSAGKGATIEPAQIAVRVAAGKVERFPFALRLAGAPSPLAGRTIVPVTAALQPAGGERTEAQVTLPVAEVPFAGVPLVEAEAFTEQSGGEVHLRTDKPGSSAGRAFSHWDNPGHRLAWQIEVPKAGRYHLVFRYACGQESERSLRVDGKALPGLERLTFPPSGGLGGAAGEWSAFAVRLPGGRLAAWELAAGAHTIVMENVNGRPLNLDQIALVPAVP